VDKIEIFINELTKDWTNEDWQTTSRSDLYYHVTEWLNQGNNLNDMFLAKFKFERYMGW